MFKTRNYSTAISMLGYRVGKKVNQSSRYINLIQQITFKDLIERFCLLRNNCVRQKNEKGPNWETLIVTINLDNGFVSLYWLSIRPLGKYAILIETKSRNCEQKRYEVLCVHDFVGLHWLKRTHKVNDLVFRSVVLSNGLNRQVV